MPKKISEENQKEQNEQHRKWNIQLMAEDVYTRCSADYLNRNPSSPADSVLVEKYSSVLGTDLSNRLSTLLTSEEKSSDQDLISTMKELKRKALLVAEIWYSE